MTKYESGQEIQFKDETYLEVASCKGGFILAIHKDYADDFPAPVVLIPNERIVNALKLQRVEDKMMEVE